MSLGLVFGFSPGAGRSVRAPEATARAEAKTKPTGQSITAHLDAIEDESCRKACKELAVTTKRVPGCMPKTAALEELLVRSAAEARRCAQQAGGGGFGMD